MIKAVSLSEAEILEELVGEIADEYDIGVQLPCCTGTVIP